MLQSQCLCVGLLLLFSTEKTIYIFANEIIRDFNGDLFAAEGCGHQDICKRRTKRCEANSIICREANATCDNSLCCFCQCKANNGRSTYVRNIMRNISMCAGNSKLFGFLNIDQKEYHYRLVSKGVSGQSCVKKTVPVIQMKTPGSHLLEMCANPSGLKSVNGCTAHSNTLTYFVDGHWHPYPLEPTGASFKIEKTKFGLMLQWERSFGSHSINNLFSISVSCSIDGRGTKNVKTCLVVKSTNYTTDRHEVMPSKPQTTRTDYIAVPSTSITTQPKVTTKVDINATQFLDVQSATSSTVLTVSPFTKGAKEEKVKFFMIAIVGCTVFIACISVLCMLLCLVRRKRRREMNSRSKRNPLYNEGLNTRFTTAPSKLSLDQSSSRETKQFYQPLTQNTRIKDIKQPSVYQPLANKPKNMETIKEQSESPRNGCNQESHDDQMHRATNNLLATQNKPYKAITPAKEKKRERLRRQGKTLDGNYYSTPEMFQTVIMPVNMKRLEGYYEPECIVLSNMPKQSDENVERQVFSNGSIQHEYDVLKDDKGVKPYLLNSNNESNKNT